MPLTRQFKETVQARVRRDRKYRKELLREGVECLLAADLDTGKAILRDYMVSPSDRNGHHRCLHASNVVPLCRAARNVVLLEAMLGELGFGMTLPQEHGKETPTQIMHEALVAMGELLSQAATDMADGDVDDQELVRELPLLHAMRDKLDELIVAGEKLRRNGGGRS